MEQISRMAAEVNKLIGSNILAGKALHLQGVGSLYIIVSPEGNKRIDFSSAEQGLSLIEVIKDRAGCTPEQALEIYSRWLAEVRTSAGIIVVDGVGELRGKTFVMAESFAVQLNPEAIKLKKVVTVKEVSAPATPAAPAVPAAEAAEAEAAAPAPEKKKSCKALWISLIVVAVLIGAGVGYYFYDKGQKESAQIEATARAEAAEQQRVADSIAMAELEARRMAEAEAALLASQVTPRYKVVYGVYELRSNVDVAIKHINAQYGEDRGQEYPFGSYTLVSMFESDDRAEAQEFLMEYYELYPDSWVYDSQQ